MRKRAPLFTEEERRDMAISDHTIEIDERLRQGHGEGTEKILGRVISGRIKCS